MKGIILAGGAGTRLHPATLCISKQLLPVYDKPMVYHPLSTLMLAGIKDILVIIKPEEKHLFQHLLADGSALGINIQYAEQDSPGGIAQAFLIGESFIGGDSVCLALGDNIIYGDNMTKVLASALNDNSGATVFAYSVQDPQRYGVVAFDKHGKPTSIEEKPQKPKSNLAIPGLYFFDQHVVEIAKKLKPSARGELEITDVLKHYLTNKKLNVTKFARGYAWFDAGTHTSLLEASRFMQLLEQWQGIKVGCPEEIAWRLGYINDKQLLASIQLLEKSSYGQYLKGLLS